MSKAATSTWITAASQQVERAINCPLVYTNAFTVYPLICAINPGVPNNEGMLIAPSQSRHRRAAYLNPEYPAAVGARNLTGHLLTTAVFGTLAQALPADRIANRLLADSASPRPHIVVTGQDDDGRAFSSMMFIAGGMGARPNKDGIPCIAFPSSARNTSVEILENSAPFMIERKWIRENSGGRGRYRGGDGQIFELRVRAKSGASIAVFSDHSGFRHAEWTGVTLPGAGTEIKVNGVAVQTKGTVRVKQTDVCDHTIARGWRLRQSMTDRATCCCYSIRMLAALITFAHLSRSVCIKAPNSAGLLLAIASRPPLT